MPYTLPRTGGSENGTVPKRPQSIMAETDYDVVHWPTVGYKHWPTVGYKHWPTVGYKHWMSSTANQFARFPNLATLGILF